MNLGNTVWQEYSKNFSYFIQCEIFFDFKRWKNFHSSKFISEFSKRKFGNTVSQLGARLSRSVALSWTNIDASSALPKRDRIDGQWLFSATLPHLPKNDSRVHPVRTPYSHLFSEEWYNGIFLYLMTNHVFGKLSMSCNYHWSGKVVGGREGERREKWIFTRTTR